MHDVHRTVMRSCLVVTFLLFAHAAHAQSDAAIPMPSPIADKGYHLVKNWDFSTNVPDLDALHKEFYTRYIYGGGTTDHLNDEWSVYRDNNNHIISDGALHLVARIPNGMKPGAVESGMIRSKWTGEYGYYEARVKIPHGQGMWPGFWLNPEDGKWPPEIDIVEIATFNKDASKKSYHFVHGKDVGKTVSSLLQKDSTYNPGFDYADDFHNFAVEWTPSSVRHYVDNVLVVEREFKWQHADGSDGGPAHILFNLGVGGKWPGPPISESEFPASLDIAYIRVWQKDQ